MALSLNIDNFISQNSVKGGQPRLTGMSTRGGTTTAATTGSGYTSGQRYSPSYTLPSSFGAGVTGAILTECALLGGASADVLVAGLEVLLGSIDLSTGTFTDGSAMPTRTVNGTSIQTGAVMPMMVVDTNLTATTPVITVTYKNQAGTGSRSAALTLPTNASAKSAFLMAPHLQSGDSGIQDVTNITKSAGTVGVIKVYGVIPVACNVYASANSSLGLSNLALPLPVISFQASDVITVYRFTATAASKMMLLTNFVADN